MEVAASTLMLSRIQFGANITFHILFPSISIALAWLLFFFKIRFNKTNDSAWQEAYAFWVKIFALTFALGVVSGITMSFQFGTNWPGYMQTVGNIAGPLLAYEVLTAFFLEATFLGIMLFGAQRVSNKTHTVATFLVAAGTTLSAFWIIALNSWMQTPQGFEMIDGQAHATDWLAIIFNPSLPYRLAHMLLASGLTVAFLVAGISAYRLLKKSSARSVHLSLQCAIRLAAILIPLQILGGDLHGINTLEHQPAKIAAMEGLWETHQGAPAVLFGIPDSEKKLNHFEISIPNLASLYLTHSWNGEVKGVKAFETPPPVGPLFFAFRIMVGIGLLMLAVAWFSAWQLRRKKSLGPFLLKTLVAMTFSGWLAVVSGWYVAEIGRQPYLVYGVLKTVDAAAKLPPAIVGTSLAMYIALYIGLTLAYITTLFYLARHADQADRRAY